MHFEVIAAPAEIRAGIDWNTVPAEPPNPDSPSTWPTLHKGDKRKDVVNKLHESLKKAGFTKLDKPGVFGVKTDAAVREYQASRKLSVDGWVGIGTWTALLSDLPKLRKKDPAPAKFETRPGSTHKRPVVQFKDKGSHVEELQRRLVELHFDESKIDGIFVAKTRKAVKDFQRAHHLTADGIVGPKTWAELYK